MIHKMSNKIGNYADFAAREGYARTNERNDFFLNRGSLLLGKERKVLPRTILVKGH